MNLRDWLNCYRENVRPTNEDIVAALNDPEKLAAGLKNLEEDARHHLEMFLERRRAWHELQDLEKATKQVTTIYKGVAVIHSDVASQKEGFEVCVYAAACKKYVGGNLIYPRSARIYRNAHNRTTWGFSTTLSRQSVRDLEDFKGSKFTNFDELHQQALDWVVIKGQPGLF